MPPGLFEDALRRAVRGSTKEGTTDPTADTERRAFGGQRRVSVRLVVRTSPRGSFAGSRKSASIRVGIGRSDRARHVWRIV